MFERDADIGHREFDLRLTDRATMRMVGVPEASFEFWAAKFIAKGYRVARVDQLETALGKEMRERAGAVKNKKEDIIRRELTAVLTVGTLVDPELLSGEWQTYCCSIKESIQGHRIHFGICFVDTSTGHFQFCMLEDDESRSNLDTLMVQVHPKEIVFEKVWRGCGVGG